MKSRGEQRFLWLAYLPSILLMAGIFMLGGDSGSSEKTGGALHSLFPGLSPATLKFINYSLRKFGHVSTYALLGGLNLWASSQRRRPTLGMMLSATLAAAAWAAVDEWHQSFASTRGASAWDVLLDSCGAVMGVLLVGRFLHRGPRDSAAGETNER